MKNSKNVWNQLPGFRRCSLDQNPIFSNQFVDPPKVARKALAGCEWPIHLPGRWLTSQDWDIRSWWWKEIRRSLGAWRVVYPPVIYKVLYIQPVVVWDFPLENQCLEDNLCFFLKWSLFRCDVYSGKSVELYQKKFQVSEQSSKGSLLRANTLQWIPCPWSSTRPAIQVMCEKALNSDVMFVLIVEHGVYCQIATGWPHLQDGIPYMMKMTWICFACLMLGKNKHSLPNGVEEWWFRMVKSVKKIPPEQQIRRLVGGWTNPVEKYARQFCQISQVRVNIKNVWVATTQKMIASGSHFRTLKKLAPAVKIPQGWPPTGGYTWVK